MAEYIERGKVYNMLNALGGCDAEPDTWADGWDKAIDTAVAELSKIPLADVRSERRGKWETDGGILVPDENGEFRFNRTYSCSECGWSCNCVKELGFDFCPGCGAMMDKEENDNA